ncbi:rRNA maturation RNase YbeY [Arthrobacter echini]|uniref:Endoribonuclease YbeY n=1 Tax=Arthrobacter echini TaxID=1529066 RepID=A0A4S5E6C7_9MICC|nr:rRNA maturation RNase YbeY [Arthrobacter echini]THJ67097.1 rRNA maturation RNase YbeY [Arthrobacter echini]
MSVEVNNETDYDVDGALLVRLTNFLFESLFIHPEAELSIVLVDVPAMEKLHVEWMDEPGPTDVLSFPMDELRPGTPGQVSSAGLLGDIVLCPEVAETQGTAAGHGTDGELLLLTTHGVLHLLGYDHAEPDEEKEMFDLQGRLLAEFLEGRASRETRA